MERLETFILIALLIMPGVYAADIVNTEKNPDMNSGFTDSSQGSNTRKNEVLSVQQESKILARIQNVSLENYNTGPGDFNKLIADVINYVINFFSSPESKFSESLINHNIANSGLPEVRIEHGSFYSTVLEKQRNYTALLPPGYPARQYPVYYLLHGAWGDERTWTTRGDIVRVYQEMLAAGEITDIIIVMPDGDNSVWDSSCGIMACGDYDGYFLELAREIDASYNTTGKRAIGGLSFGGRGSMRLAFMHPDMFGFAGGHSGYYYYLIQEMKDEDWARLNSSGMTVYFDNSKNDPLTDYSESSRLLNITLSKKGIPHEYRELDFYTAQSHAWPYWKKHVRVALQKACNVIC